MTLLELLDEVYNLTNRRDLGALTLSAVRSATLKAHAIDYFYKDIQESTIAYTSLDYIQQFEYQTLFPRWRALKYLRKLDVSTTPYTPGVIFDIVDVSDILDAYKITKDNICYVAGANLNARSTTQFQYCSIGYYQQPLVGNSNATFESWIANDSPWAIIFTAAATVCKAIGKETESNGFRTLAAEQYALLKTTAILANGY